MEEDTMRKAILALLVGTIALAPAFAADQFHPWVWQAAAQFWDAGQSAFIVIR